MMITTAIPIVAVTDDKVVDVTLAYCNRVFQPLDPS